MAEEVVDGAAPEFPEESVTMEAAGCPTHARWGQDVADEIVRRTEAGEPLRAICRGEGMPTTRAVQRWLLERPQFAEAMWAARAASCQPLTGRRPVWCPETAQEIVGRVAEGESLIAICQDPLLPAYTTVYNWRSRHPEFDEALRAAQDMRAERITEGGWELARSLAAKGLEQGVERGTTRAVEVMLRQLRWHVGQLSPNRFGAKKAVEVEQPTKVKTVVLKTLVIKPGEDGEPSVFWIAPNPDTGVVERVEDGKWPGVEQARGHVGDSASKRPRPGVRPSGDAADDPEGWR